MRKMLPLFLLLIAACSSRAPSPANDIAAATPPPEAEAEDDPNASGSWTVADAGVDDSVCMTKYSVVECERCCRNLRPSTATLMYESFRTCECRKTSRSCVEECGPDFCKPDFDWNAARKQKGCLACLTKAMDGPSADCAEVSGSVCAADEDCAATYECMDRCASDAGTR